MCSEKGHLYGDTNINEFEKRGRVKSSAAKCKLKEKELWVRLKIFSTFLRFLKSHTFLPRSGIFLGVILQKSANFSIHKRVAK